MNNRRNGARAKEYRSNGNHYENGFHKYGICPKCKKEGLLTEHHIWKRSVWGPNGHTVFLCRECHDKLETKVRIMENMILRLFMPCYKALYYDFMNREEELSDDYIMKISIVGVKKTFKKIVDDSIEFKEGWIVRRMQKKGVLLRKKEQ